MKREILEKLEKWQLINLLLELDRENDELANELKKDTPLPTIIKYWRKTHNNLRFGQWLWNLMNANGLWQVPEANALFYIEDKDLAKLIKEDK